MQSARNQYLSKILLTVSLIFACSFSIACNELAVMVGSAGRAKKTTGINEVKLDSKGLFVINWDLPKGNQSSDVSYDIYGESFELPPAEFRKASESFLNYQILAAKNELSLTSSKKLLGGVKNASQFVWTETPDTKHYYVFEIRPNKLKVAFENSKIIAKLGLTKLRDIKIAMDDEDKVNLSWADSDGVEIFEIYKDGQLFTSSENPELIFDREQSRSQSNFCVKARVGNVLSHDCQVLDRVGSNWKPFIKSIKLLNPQTYYKAGDVLQFTAKFTDKMSLKSGASLRLDIQMTTSPQAAYLSGSGTDTWIFRYQVGNADNSADIRFMDKAVSSVEDAATSSSGGQRLDESLPLRDPITSVIDSTHPSAPLSPGFPVLATASTQVSLSFGLGQDANFDTHEAKLCSAIDCTTGCLASVLSPTSPFHFTAPANQTFYGCVRSLDKAQNMSAWTASFQSITIDTIPPTVSAGADLLARASVLLDGSSSGAVRFQWTQTSGPGTLTFTTATAEDSMVQADMDGVYTIELKAFDAAGNEASDSMTLTWDSTPPSFAMGLDRYLRAPTLVDVTVTGASTYQWTKISGPGAITFGTATSEDTTVEADTEGLYVLRLTATDLAGNSSFSDLNMTWDVTAPSVNVGADLMVKAEASIVSTVTGASDYAWTKVSGTGVITYGTASEANTTVTADTDGSYVLRLTATDEAGNSASDDLTFIWDTTAPAFAGINAHYIANDDTSGHLRWAPALDSFTSRWDILYDICQSTTQGACASNFTTSFTTELGASSYYLSGLNPSLSYEYVVRARDLLGNRDTNTTVFSTRKIANVVQLSAGQNFSCARYADETVACWGRGNNGQLGNGSSLGSESPQVVTGLSNVTQIASSKGSTCALISDGTIKCWGLNSSGQLGNNSTTNSSIPVLVSGISNAIQIAVGTASACATLNDSTARCWGLNSSGQLGNGNTTNSLVPLVITLTSDIRSVGVGDSFACAVIGAARTIQCWGSGAQGRLGNGSSADSPAAAVTVSGLSGIGNLYVSYYKACATINGGLRCWGDNGWGQLGNGSNANSSTPVVAFADGSNVAEVGLGEFFTCASLSDGTGRCWGNNDSSQLGIYQDWNQRWEPTVMNGDPKFTFVAAGSTHACAVGYNSGSSVKCWGSNSYSELGTSVRSTDVPYPTVINSSDTFTKVAAGGYHSCGILSDKTVKCWGANTWGQIADGTQHHVHVPKLIPGISSAIDIASTEQGSCAALADGTIKCWGENDRRQIGDGTTTNAYAPVTVQNITNAVSIGSGQAHYCALLADATVRCWGQGDLGQLGNGANVDNGTPQVVSGLTSVTQLSTGFDHSCAKVSGGSVYCWGSGDFGELGQGSNSDSNVPVLVTAANNIAKIRAAWDFTCAILNDGTARCWGYGSGGELGNGVNAHSLAAVTVSGVTGAQDLYTWSDHSCVKIDNNDVRCWGGNNSRQLGVVTSNPSLPNRLSLTNVSAISTGYYHTCSLSGSGKLRCWGYNGYGQTGIFPMNVAAWSRTK